MCRIVTAYPHLRESLSPEFVEVSDEQLGGIVAELYGDGVAAEDVENFLRDVGRGFQRVGRGAAKFAGQAAPGIIQGATTGAALGPWGALAGAVVGGAGSVLSRQRNPTLRGIGNVVGGVTRAAGGLTGGGALRNAAGLALGGARGGAAGGLGQLAGSLGPQLAAAAGGRGFNANALLGVLSRPETLRALSAAALSPYGRPQVPVGAQQVPVQSILGTVGQLAGRAAAEAEYESEHYPEHYFDSAGELAIDPADAEQRTWALLELFAATPPSSHTHFHDSDETDEFAGDDAGEADEAEYTAADAAYDEWLLANETEWANDSEEEFHV